MTTVIKVDNLGKKYLIRHQQREKYVALRDVITNKFKSVGKKVLQHMSHELRAKSSSKEDFWALKDISFEIKQGDRVGIIGRNGAGKTTLLKLLSRITEPTTGRITLKGRVASLLEVGTGFHPELTGRENIFLNGAILGMSKSEIKKKFDEIVDFAEIEKFLDTPVKRYSSGMYVRLAFAVAAHLEPEILLVDEVLAVGDAQFQKKCFGKMGEIGNEGKTVLFVSHNMAAIQNFCNRGILLEAGDIKYSGNINETINAYISAGLNNIHIPLSIRKNRQGSGLARITGLQFISHNKNPYAITCDEQVIFKITYESKINNFRGRVLLSCRDIFGCAIVFLDSNTIKDFPEKLPKNAEIVVTLSQDFGLPPGRYTINIALLINEEMADYMIEAIVFNIDAGDFFGRGVLPNGDTQCLVKQTWKILEK
jgi:lipopolysaccharide transport system ATP-binding protein